MKKLLVRLWTFYKDLKIYKSLKIANFDLIFSNDNNVLIKIPKYNIFDLIFRKPHVKMINQFSQRINAEPMLRKICALLITQFIEKDSVIIDIGSWIGDNSIPWAKLIGKNGTVLAIDPSKGNLSNIKMITKLNKIDNLISIQGVASSETDEKLSFNGDINHATFKKFSKVSDQKIFYSTTLDKIYRDNLEYKKVSLIHLDVEGFEFNVLKGSKEIIKLYSPIIIFEIPISQQFYDDIFEYFKTIQYETRMINEVINGNDLDCRNFIAFPMKNENLIKIINSHEFKSKYIFKASLGQNLV